MIGELIRKACEDIGGKGDPRPGWPRGSLSQPPSFAYMPKQTDEVAPPGGEPLVKGLKKHGDQVDNPYALAWWMKSKGYGPFKRSRKRARQASATSTLAQLLRHGAEPRETSQAGKFVVLARRRRLLTIASQEAVRRLASRYGGAA